MNNFEICSKLQFLYDKRDLFKLSKKKFKKFSNKFLQKLSKNYQKLSKFIKIYQNLRISIKNFQKSFKDQVLERLNINYYLKKKFQ